MTAADHLVGLNGATHSLNLRGSSLRPGRAPGRLGRERGLQVRQSAAVAQSRRLADALRPHEF